jgi:hypothetical protein
LWWFVLLQVQARQCKAAAPCTATLISSSKSSVVVHEHLHSSVPSPVFTTKLPLAPPLLLICCPIRTNPSCLLPIPSKTQSNVTADHRLPVAVGGGVWRFCVVSPPLHFPPAVKGSRRRKRRAAGWLAMGKNPVPFITAARSRRRHTQKKKKKKKKYVIIMQGKARIPLPSIPPYARHARLRRRFPAPAPASPPRPHPTSTTQSRSLRNPIGYTYRYVQKYPTSFFLPVSFMHGPPCRQ